MIHKMFAIFDSKAECYMKPFGLKTKGEAIRVFTDMANDESHELCKHSEDYTLFELGEYDDNTGKVLPLDTPLPVGKAIEFKRSA